MASPGAPANPGEAVQLQGPTCARSAPAPPQHSPGPHPPWQLIPCVCQQGSTSEHQTARPAGKGSSYRLDNAELLAFLHFLDLVHILERGLKEVVSLFVHLKVSLEKEGEVKKENTSHLA